MFLHQFLTCPSVSAKSSIMDTIKQLADPRGGLRRGAAILQVSTLFMVRKDAPAHAGSFSRSPALLRRLHTQGKWHRIGCAASGTDGGVGATLTTCFSCMPFSCDQKLLLTSPLPIFAENNRRKTQSLDELKHLSVFADRAITGQWTNSMGRCHCSSIWITCLGEYSLISTCFNGVMWKAKWLMLRQWYTAWDSSCSGMLEKKAKLQ